MENSKVCLPLFLCLNQKTVVDSPSLLVLNQCTNKSGVNLKMHKIYTLRKHIELICTKLPNNFNSLVCQLFVFIIILPILFNNSLSSISNGSFISRRRLRLFLLSIWYSVSKYSNNSYSSQLYKNNGMWKENSLLHFKTFHLTLMVKTYVENKKTFNYYYLLIYKVLSL